MEHLLKINRLSSFFLEKNNNNEVEEFFKDVQERAKKVLNLPEDIILAGFSFDHSDYNVNLKCGKMCTEVINGKIHYYCCS